MNLDEYYHRIGFEGAASADLATLQALHHLHPTAIPFEHFDVLLDRGIQLDQSSFWNKLVHQSRGGYCFEHNGLFEAVLKAIGFEVEPLLARVLWNRKEDSPSQPRTHKALRVMIDGEPWLADVGFGGLVLTAPLRLNTDASQPTQHESFRLIDLGYGYRLEANLPKGWMPVYELSNAPQIAADFEVANWYTSTHPDSHFRHNLMLARTTWNTRFALLNNRLSIRHKGEPPQVQYLDKDELFQAVIDTFRIALSRDDFDQAISRTELFQD